VVASHAQENPLFVRTTALGADLSQSQQQRLDEYRRDPSAGNVEVVGANLALTATADALNVNVVADQTLQLSTVRRDSRSPSDYTWVGADDEGTRTATLVVQGDEIVGTVRDGDRLFRVRPLGDGLHAVIEVDLANLPPDHPPGAEYDAPPASGALLDLRAAPSLTCSTQTLLVAYTEGAETEAGNIDGLIQLAVDETNQSYANSGVTPRVQMVHKYKTNYTESGDMVQDRDRFRIAGDGHMDEVHALRDQYAADIAILMTRSGGFCGIAAAILADESTAFAVVGQNCATGYYSFGHEVGHLQGARHNPEVDSSSTPFPHGHGLFHEPDSWRTVMSYNCPGGCVRRDHWSNPDVQIGGVPTGTVAGNDNSRVLDETSCTVAGFREPERAPATFEYAAKVVCGRQPDEEELRLVRGLYGTTVNIHNFNDRDVRFLKKLALSYPPPEQRPGKVIPISTDRLGPDQALKVDCPDLRRRLFPRGFPTSYIEGFVVLQSDAELDVTGVYTVGGLDRQGRLSDQVSMDVELIRGRRKGEIGEPDLAPVPDGQGRFCRRRDGKLVVTVRNQGAGGAGASTTRVDFGVHGNASVATPGLAASDSTEILVDIPPRCFDADCEFRITVDASSQVAETNEGNNEASGTCIG
jgi:hypothetical protein